jgi:putative isomerase
MHRILVPLFCIVLPALLTAQPVERNIRTAEYRQLQKELSSGWSTWYNNSVITQALLPESFAINLCFVHKNSSDFLKEVLPAAAILKRPEKVSLGLRADDGSYTSLRLQYKGDEFDIQTASQDGELYILITPQKVSPALLVSEAGILWNAAGTAGVSGDHLFGDFSRKRIRVYCTEKPVQHTYAASTAPHLTFPLTGAIGLSTGRRVALAEIQQIISAHKAQQERRIASYGDMAGPFTALQTVLAWNTIYDAANQRVITPVSRLWNYRWGAGYVLFNWDTYFASYMLALFNKKLAYANAIEMTKAITPEGFVPNFQSIGRGVSLDRSQPPVGSTLVWHIYQQYKEKWFLQEVYPELLTWNRWWPQHRSIEGYLSWGSFDPQTRRLSQTFSKYESGLDNSPMYDGVPLDSNTHTLALADVGLISLYIADCQSLAAMASELGRHSDAAELKKRAATYKLKLNTLWDEKTGIYLNKRLDKGELSKRLSPTNFYPLIAGVPTEAQAARMLKEHFYNPAEFWGEYLLPSVPRNDPAFKDNDYWRGRIWGPLNFLTYLGLRNYETTQARADLIERSRTLFLKNWNKEKAVYENNNALTGEGGDVLNADGSYHWGALLVFMEFIERGMIK